MVTNDWRLWGVSMVFTLVVTFAFMVYIWWTERKREKARNDDDGAKPYTDAEGYYLCVFLKDGGCDLYKSSEVVQVVNSLHKEYINVVLRNASVHYENDVASYEFKHIFDLSLYNLKNVKRVTE